MLSIRLMTFGYVGGSRSPRYTLGTVLGVIGPCAARTSRPRSCGAGVSRPQQGGASLQGINYFTGLVDEDAELLFLDLGNALPLAATDGSMMDIGSLSAGLLLDPQLAEQAR